MKTELIKEFEEKYQRSRFLQDTGIGDMHSEQGCYCDEYVEFLEQKLANGAEQIDSNCNIPHVSNRRELLIAYGEWIHELAGCKDTEKATTLADSYLSNL